MTQFYTEDGVVHPATILVAGPLTVTGVKTEDRDGYQAVQVGFGEQKKDRINKAQLGQFKDLGNFRYVREFRNVTDKQVGDVINIEDFKVGDTVQVSATSKGKGFQGVVKRHNFAGGRRTHGQKHSEREPGSIGATGPQRVFKGTRMAGRMGSDRITVKNLTVLAIDPKQNMILVKGAVPGRRGTLVEVVGK